MKLVLKDTTEITLSSSNENYNAKEVEDSEKRSITFTIADPTDDVTIDYLKQALTVDNTSEMSLVYANGSEKVIKPCRVSSISENISDDSHFIAIRVYFI